VLVALLAGTLVPACGGPDPVAQGTASTVATVRRVATYRDRLPDAVIGSCAEPLAAGAPVLAGLWLPESAERAGRPVPADDPLLSDLQRVEQCGNRVVLTEGGAVRDMVGTYRDGAHAVMAADGSVVETRRRDGDQLVWTRGDTTVRLGVQARYGTPNVRYIRSWKGHPDHGPMWALNLMKYRDVADYRDGRPSTITGEQADDLYNPVAALAAVGARPVLLADVVAQPVGDRTTWDRVAIAEYPTRSAFLALKSVPGFDALFQHKEAGMDRTIVNATFPHPGTRPPTGTGADPAPDDRLLLDVVRDPSTPAFAPEIDSTPVGTFDVEDVLIGDHRSWGQVRWRRISRATADELAAGGTTKADDRYVVVLVPRFDSLAASLADDAAGTYPPPAG